MNMWVVDEAHAQVEGDMEKLGARAPVKAGTKKTNESVLVQMSCVNGENKNELVDENHQDFCEKME
eukprot:GAFH01006201.1.p4 GENE.GAFH01006201.1~~GAFH01006201.1.p4  ORF type:complete len:66 (+),score=14.46 GAFH01006201.1:179-376(+)